MDFPSPSGPGRPRDEVFLQYLDYFRERVTQKVASLPHDALVVSVVPTDWTALELVKHLTYVEMRWLEWGFEGRTVADPWGDHVGDRWGISPDDTRESLLEQLLVRSPDHGNRSAPRTRRTGQPGPRWSGAEPATLESILFHLLQEYARHLGHLDVYSELADGQLGE